MMILMIDLGHSRARSRSFHPFAFPMGTPIPTSEQTQLHYDYFDRLPGIPSASLGGAYIVVYVCDPRRRLATRSRHCSAQVVHR